MVSSELYAKASNTPAKYRFSLLNPDTNELKRLVTPPMEWENGVIQVDRNINVGGVFTSFSVDSLTFLKEGAKFLRDIWDEKEMNGRCHLIVEYWKQTTFSYVEMPTRFSLNFATAKPNTKVGNQSIGFQIEAVKDDILVKLENRKNKSIDITKTTSIGGFSIVDYTDLKKDILFADFNLRFQTIWAAFYIGNNGYLANDKNHEIFTQYQMNFNANDFGNEAVEMDYKTNLTSANSITRFFNSDEDRTVNLNYIITVEVTNRKGGIFNPQNVYAGIVQVLEGSTVVLEERIFDVGKNKGTFFFNSNLEINLEAGQSIRTYVKTDDTDGIEGFIRSSQFRLTHVVSEYDARTVEGFPIYNTFERVLQHIADTQFPFYSDFFGTLDNIYNTNGDKYLSENQLRFASIMSGLNLRGARLFDSNNPLPITFDDLFQSLNSMYNLGYETELRDGFTRIRIENYDYFFEDVEALDLSDRLKIYDIEKESMPELAYSQINSGYDDYSYERINGRGEYNTESSRTSVINTDKTYDLISPLRADTMGIVGKIVTELDTEDTEEDNELFIIKTQRDGDDWKPERQENIQIVDDTSLFDNDSLNLYYTPTRNLLRHGNRIKGALIKYLSSYLRFQKSSKLQTLKTTDGTDDITENDDIQVNDLDDAIFKPLKYTVTCKFTFEDFETLMTNPKGYIKLSSTLNGYLLSLKKKNNEDRATLELIHKI